MQCQCTTSDIRCLDLLTVKLYLAVLESRDRVCVSEQLLKCETVQSSFVFCVWDCGLCIVCLRLWVGYCVVRVLCVRDCRLCIVFCVWDCGLWIVYRVRDCGLGRQSGGVSTLARTVGQIKCHPHQYICATATLPSSLFPTISYVGSHPWAAPPCPTMGTRGRLLAPEPKWISQSSQMDFSGVRLWFPRLNFPGARFLALRQDGALSDSQVADEGWFPLADFSLPEKKHKSEFMESKDM